MKKIKKYMMLMISVITLLGLLGCSSKVEKSVWLFENEFMKETLTVEYNKDTVSKTEAVREIDISANGLTEKEANDFIKENKEENGKQEYSTYTGELKDGIIYEKIIEDMKKVNFKKLSEEIGDEIDYISYDLYLSFLDTIGYTEVK